MLHDFAQLLRDIAIVVIFILLIVGGTYFYMKWRDNNGLAAGVVNDTEDNSSGGIGRRCFLYGEEIPCSQADAILREGIGTGGVT